MPAPESTSLSPPLAAGEPPWTGKWAVGMGLALGTWFIVVAAYRMLLGHALAFTAGPSWLQWLSPRLAVGHLPGVAVAALTLVLGIAWVGAANVYLFQNTLAAWRGVIFLALVSTWFAGGLNVALAAQIVLLCLPVTRRQLAAAS